MGTVKWFDEAKGYGFIGPVDGSKDIFVHISAALRGGIDHLQEGMQLSYEIGEGRRPGTTEATNLAIVL